VYDGDSGISVLGDLFLKVERGVDGDITLGLVVESLGKDW
jgi:hypothetical protein